MSSSTAATTTSNIIKIALKAGGERTNVVDEAEARCILKRFQSTVEKTKRRFGKSAVVVVVNKLDLSCRVWTPNALTVLRHFLESIASTLEILKCDDMIASLSTEDGLSTLSLLSDIFANNCRVLQELNVNDNALGTRGLQRLGPLLSLSTISRIYLQNCGLSGEAATETLRECLNGRAALTPSITRIYLQNCGLSGEAATETLRECLNGRDRALTHVALGLNQMGERGAICLGEILQSTSSSKIEYLSYKGSRPLRKGTHGLLQGLASADTSHLRHLDLNDCDFTTSLQLLGQVLQNSPQLHSLILRDGALGKDGLRVVLQALYTSGAQLRLLDLGAMFGNDDDNDDDDETKHVESAMELGRYLATQWSTLETLVLGDTEWHNTAILALITASGPLFTCPEHTVLRVLNLEASMLTGSDVLHVLAHNPIPTLQELNLIDNNDLTAGVALRMLQNEVYSTAIVKVDDDLEEEEDDEEEEDSGDEDDDDVDALAAELSHGAQIAD